MYDPRATYGAGEFVDGGASRHYVVQDCNTRRRESLRNLEGAADVFAPRLGRQIHLRVGMPDPPDAAVINRHPQAAANVARKLQGLIESAAADTPWMQRHRHDALGQHTCFRDQMFSQQSSKEPSVRQFSVELELLDQMIDGRVIPVRRDRSLEHGWLALADATQVYVRRLQGQGAARAGVSQAWQSINTGPAKIEVVVPSGLAQ